MAVRYSKPKVHCAEKMFIFWAENLKKDKPHLIIKNLNNNAGHRSKPIELWYEVKEELAYLQTRNLYLDEQIMKLEIIDREVKRFTSLTEEIFEMKTEIVNNKNKIKQLSKLDPKSKQLILSYPTFRLIIEKFNLKASEEIITGKTINLGNRLGYVQIRKIEPEIRSKNDIDWAESNKYKKELLDNNQVIKDKNNPDGKNWLIYRNTSYYLRWAWVKKYTCTVKNNRVYAFYPTESGSSTKGKDKILGNKSKLANAQFENNLLHTKYTVVKLKTRRSGEKSVIINN